MSHFDTPGYSDPKPRRAAPRAKKTGNFFLFYLLPFVLVNLLIFYVATAQPSFTLTIEEPKDFKSAGIRIDIKRRLPLSFFTVKLDDTPVELEQLSRTHYTASLDRNGTLEVSLGYKNGMTRTQYEHISTIDDAPPTILGNELDHTMLTVFFDDTQSGVNFASLYALDADGKRVSPTQYDEKELSATFQALTDILEVHISDHSGNEAISSFDGLSLLGNGGADRSGDYHSYGSENTAASEKSETRASSEKSESRTSSERSETGASSTKSESRTSSERSETGASSTKSESRTSSERSETGASSAESETKASSARSESASAEKPETGATAEASEKPSAASGAAEAASPAPSVAPSTAAPATAQPGGADSPAPDGSTPGASATVEALPAV